MEPLVSDRTAANPTMETIERAYIMWVLESEQGNKTRAAEVLGIDPSTLHRPKLSRFGVEDVIDGPRRSRGATWYPLAAGAVVGAIALAAITAVPVGVFWDDGVYLIGAKSLATGAGYRFLHLPGAPPAVHFPPLWPALLAIGWKLSPSFPDNGGLLKLVNPLLLAIGAALAGAYGVRRVGGPPLVAALAAVVFAAAALPVMVIAGVLFSEPLFRRAAAGARARRRRGSIAAGWRPSALAAGIAARGALRSSEVPASSSCRRSSSRC